MSLVEQLEHLHRLALGDSIYKDLSGAALVMARALEQLVDGLVEEPHASYRIQATMLAAGALAEAERLLG